MAMTPMPTVLTLEDNTPLLSQPEALRALAARQGFLFFKGLLDRDKVLALRRTVLELCQKHGWLDESAPLMEGRVRSGLSIREGDELHKPFYWEAQTLRALHEFALSPEILSMFETLFGEPVLAHSRNILRAIFPNSSHLTTPAHQDYVQIGGTQETWTSWIPLGDCPRQLGGLALTGGLHTQGQLEMKSAYGAGGVGVDIPEGTPWYTIDYQAGDLVTFHSLEVHQGQDNLTGNLMRLSVDFRYQPASHVVQANSLRPHTFEKDWSRIYSAWPDENDPLKHYWEKLSPQVTEELPPVAKNWK